MRGRPFRAERAVLEGFWLTLRDGDEFFADRSVSFSVPEDVLDGTRTLDVSGTWSPGMSGLFLGVLEPGESLPDTRIVSSGYALKLTFGESKPYGAPFDIALVVDGEAPTRVVGSFFATRGDIRVIDGELDRTHDSFDTLHLIGREHVALTRPDARVDDVSNHGYSSGEGTGFGEVTIVDGDGAETRLSLSYVRDGKDDGKDDGKGWRVARELEPGSTELAAARAPYARLRGEMEEDIGELVVDGLEQIATDLSR